MSSYAYRRADWVTSPDFIKLDVQSDEEASEWAEAHQEFFPDGPVQVFKRETPEHDWELLEEVRQEDVAH
ncbi:hypothetical protein [Psychromicrobium lacuslunae]|uniref:Uncharacterized protein n=1 Tax=Psychromicrobium lacuslunae TaxID=1618207 RepID=A0A0D4C0E6_9MICC|nr:hypothetical protein [Psychromicrobium lacuslunae]AJT41841.1 hypothetical protein UM93_10525 [Psychromicrobium lacuslunae]